MEQTVTVDMEKLLPILLTVLAPTITGFLQQWNKKFAESSSWIFKGLVTSIIGSLIGVVAGYAAEGDILLNSAAGAIIGGFGAVNIAFRKGTRANLAIEAKKEACPPVVP
jgi:hypothetical protein